MPTVSIGVPVYNGEAYVGQALDCLLSQTFHDLEIVICDNASEDRTVTICNDFVRRDGRVRLYHNPRNDGAPRNYNRVFELSSGRYFKWAAADDLIAPDFVERCLDGFERTSGAALVYPRTVIIDAEGHPLHEEPDPIRPTMEDPVARFENVLSSLRECNAIFGLIKRDVLARTHLIGTYNAADGHLLAEIALYGKLVSVDKALFYRREHPGSSSYDKSDRAQRHFWDPYSGTKPENAVSRALLADIQSILRAPLTASQKTRGMRRRLQRAWWNKSPHWRELWNTARWMTDRSRYWPP